jgi:hypothetical protein
MLPDGFTAVERRDDALGAYWILEALPPEDDGGLLWPILAGVAVLVLIGAVVIVVKRQKQPRE